MRSVNSFLSTGINTPIGKYKVSVQCKIGELIGINANGELVSAEKNQVANKITRVVGVITDGSVVTIDDPRYLPNGKDYKEVGDFQELYREFKIMGVEDCQIGTVAGTFKWKKKDIGTAVYLVAKTTNGVHSAVLTTDIASLTVGAEYQQLGYLGDPARKEIIVILDNDVETKA